MGDFSVLCVISGLPIARGQNVLAFPLQPSRYEDARFPHGPVGLPVLTTMGSYGEGANLPHTPEAARVVYAHPDLVRVAADLHAKAMPKPGSLHDEMRSAREEYAKQVATFTEISEQTGEAMDASTLDFCRRSISPDPCGDTPWWSLMKAVTQSTTEARTFDHPIRTWIIDTIVADAVDARREEIEAVQTLCSAFAATTITGKPICPPALPFEQYPSFRFEAAWHSAVARQARAFRSAARARA